MAKFEKLVDYRSQFLGGFYSGKRGEEINIDKTLSESETKEVKRAVELGLIKQIGGDNLSNANAEIDEVKTQLADANAEIDSIIDDIQNMKQKDLREKYQRVEG